MRASALRILVWTVTTFGAVALVMVVFLAPANNDLMTGGRKTRIATKITLLTKTVTALERAVNHLFSVGDNINVDGVFGVRLVGEQLSALNQQVMTRGSSVLRHQGAASLLQRLNMLTKNARNFSLQFGPIAKKKHPQQYEILKHLLISGSWNLWFPVRNIDRRLLPTYGYESTGVEVMDPRLSDECLKQLHANQCSFTKNCWTHMTTSSFHGYSLTHQIFFILNAFAMGCEKQVNMASLKWTHMKTDELLTRQCAAILHEAELIANRDYPIYRQDLFMEQIAFCGILGFRDFFRDEWLKKIWGWQSEKGCYSKNVTAFEVQFSKDFPREFQLWRRPLKRFDQTLLDEKISRDLPVASEHRRRQKRSEQVLRDGCMSHMTAVALAALGQYVRFLLEPLLDDGNDHLWK